MEAAVAAVVGGLGLWQGKKQGDAQKKAVRRAAAADAADREEIRRQQDNLAAEQARQDEIIRSREAEAEAASNEQKRVRRLGGRGGLLTYLGTGAGGVTGGLSTVLGGGSR